ncbi:MAG: putative glycosyltransferase, exosortase G system-associated, partial [Oscillospiraceae bacterium]
SNIHCMTGAVLTDPNEIEATENPFVKLFRKTEFFEYCQAFLAGRNFESELDSIYTLSGAFSGFRKSTILKTQLYNTGTVCEDTHVTFQIRRILDKKVNICENSLYFVNPIENFDKLYTQRQRWQRGEIEVSHMFVEKKRKDSRGIFPNLLTKILMLDHTFAFPRMIWYFALICLAFMNYPIKLIVGSVVIIYLLYVISSFLYYVNICMYLKDFPKFRRYYARKWYLSFLLPLFNFVIFWIRFAGIINCIKSEGTWKTRTFSDEFSDFLKIIKSDFSFITKLIRKIRKAVNNG